MAVAKSPGSMVTAEKITIETTNRVMNPSPSRCNTVLRTGFTPPSSRPSCLSPPVPTRPVPTLPVRDRRAAGLPAARTLSGRSRKPPALGDLHAVALPIRRDVAMGELLRGGLDVIVEDDDDLAAIVVDELLRLGVEGGPLLLVRLAARLDENVVEVRIVPLGLVPGGALRVDHRQHPVDGRPAAPVIRAPRLLQPDIVEIPVIGLA